MSKYFSHQLIIALIGIFIVCASAKNSAEASNGDPEKIENFTLNNYDGNKYSLSDFKDSKAIVLIFISTQCPVSNAYNTRMIELNKKFKEKGVTFIGINSNKEENTLSIKKHANEKGLDFLILKDEKNIIANKLNATVTPEAYILNSNFEILYHGRIDDSQNEVKVEVKDLANALTQILNGEKVSNQRTKSFGCSIKKI